MFAAFLKTPEDTHKDVWNNPVEKKYKYDFVNISCKQTAAASKDTLKRYQEIIVIKVLLRDV